MDTPKRDEGRCPECGGSNFGPLLSRAEGDEEPPGERIQRMRDEMRQPAPSDVLPESVPYPGLDLLAKDSPPGERWPQVFSLKSHELGRTDDFVLLTDADAALDTANARAEQSESFEKKWKLWICDECGDHSEREPGSPCEVCEGDAAPGDRIGIVRLVEVVPASALTEARRERNELAGEAERLKGDLQAERDQLVIAQQQQRDWATAWAQRLAATVAALVHSTGELSEGGARRILEDAEQAGFEARFVEPSALAEGSRDDQPST
jgi:hypothetical protein